MPPSADHDLRYTETHEFILCQGGGHAIIGLNPSIAEGLGDILFVEAGVQGEELSEGDTFAVIGTQNGEIELNMPVSATILSSNDELMERPSLLANDDLETCWILEIEYENDSELDRLLDIDAYQAQL